MHENEEIEAKLLVDDTNADAALLVSVVEQAGCRISKSDVVCTVDRYFDTRNWKLFRAGWAYRWRDAGGTKSLCLKSLRKTDTIIQHRTEIEEPIDRFPRKTKALPNGDVGSVLKSLRCADALRELFRIENDRQRFDVVTEEGDTIELVCDECQVIPADKSAEHTTQGHSFREVELELKQGNVARLAALVTAIQRATGWRAARLSKFERGLHLAKLTVPRDPVARISAAESKLRDMYRQPVTADSPAGHLAYRCLFNRFCDLCDEEPRAWEGFHAEGVHQMRVATRRLRAALAAFQRQLPKTEIDKFRREFKWLANALGEVRDLDVERTAIPQYANALSVEDFAKLGEYQKYLQAEWTGARLCLEEVLVSQRYMDLRKQFRNFLGRGSVRGGGKTVSHEAQRLISIQLAAVIKAGKAIDRDSRNDQLHGLRIQCKRLRYLFEFFASVYGKSFRPAIKSLKRLQNVLGDHQDACVAEQRLRAYSETVAIEGDNRGLLLTLGQLIAVQRQKTSRHRSKFTSVWKQFTVSSVKKVSRLLE